MTKCKLELIAILVVAMLLGGCATNRSILDIHAPSAEIVSSSGKQVCIGVVLDRRTFEEKPGQPSTPSLDPKEAQDSGIRLRAIGRKRNSFGMALGDILLRDGTTVESLTREVLRQAYLSKGYDVVPCEGAPKEVVVNADIVKFWSWFNPGFATVTVSTEIETAISVSSAEGSKRMQLTAKASNGYLGATESAWTEVATQALRNHLSELQKNIQ